MKKRYLALTAIALGLLLAGFFVPLGSYTITHGVCPDEHPPTVRLHLIKGDNLQEIKAGDLNSKEPLGEGCARQVTFVLYFF